MTTPDEGSRPHPGAAKRDSHVVKDLFAAFADALKPGEAEAVRRIGAALTEAAARAQRDGAAEPESGA